MIHIITFINTYNYGSVLQAYALNRYINDNVCEAKTIYYDLSSFYNMGLKAYVKKQLIKFIYYKHYKKKTMKFEQFIENNICLEEKKFKSFNSLKKYNFNKDDIYLVGSDQCWCELDRSAFFLEFVDSENKYTYAVSLGDEIIDNAQIKYINSKTASFKGISFREKYSCDKYAKITKKKCYLHIDPVFLLPIYEYEKILQNSNFKNKELSNYTLVYCIRNSKKMDEYIDYLLKRKKRIILIGGMVSKINNSNVECYRDLGIEDFLYLIKNSGEVIADSFHAIAFSIIFKKQFKAFVHRDKNTRIENILSLLSLTDRIIKDTFNLPDIDYSKNEYDVEKLKIICDSKEYLNSIVK